MTDEAFITAQTVSLRMVSIGSPAPDFTVPKVTGRAYNDIEMFTLSDVIGDGHIVLAFYPAAFTGGCTEEMCAFRDSFSSFESLDARLYGVSVDLPFAQNVWIDKHTIGFPMLSDWNHELIESYDVVLEKLSGGFEVAERSVFVIDEEGIITYKWVRDGENPDFQTLVRTIQEAIADPS